MRDHGQRATPDTLQGNILNCTGTVANPRPPVEINAIVDQPTINRECRCDAYTGLFIPGLADLADGLEDIYSSIAPYEIEQKPGACCWCHRLLVAIS